jgi:hypothetical protein
MDMQVQAYSGSTTQVPEEALAALRNSLRGPAYLPGDAGYDTARSIWNAMIDRHPALIIQAAGAADVMQAVNFARDHRAILAVRGGGHNIAGNAVCDGGVMLDLSRMRSVHVDPAARRARVEPGATLGDVDKETQAFGLVIPTGINSTTGIAGLTLGGGFGWISRKFGLTIDSLNAVDIVTADGRLLRADAQQNSDLFWAVRGGGGNFGVVTSFDFRLHEMGPQVVSGLLVHPLEDAPALLNIAAWSPPRPTSSPAGWCCARRPRLRSSQRPGTTAKCLSSRFAIAARPPPPRLRWRHSARWASPLSTLSARIHSSAGKRRSTHCSRRAPATTGRATI